jgi:hypothetical protein
MTTFAELLINYRLEVEWLLTWFPIRPTGNLSEARIRGGTGRHSITDFGTGLGGGVSTTYMLGMGAAGQGDALAANNAVRGFITIRVTPDKIFEAELEVAIGGRSRKATLVLQPETRTPFMLNVEAAGNEEIVADTAVVLQGVFTTGQRFSLIRQMTTAIWGR